MGTTNGVPEHVDFLGDGSHVSELLRTRDWSKAAIGHPKTWPPSLRIAVSLMMASRYPMFIAWGPQLTFIYNDGYAPILGIKHPHAAGQPFREVWSEIWSDIEPIVNKALAGEATFHENLPLTMERNGYRENTWYSFSYSPVRDDNGVIQGIFCACTETTAQVLAEAALRESEEQLRLATDAAEVGLWDWRLTPDSMFWPPRVRDMFGISRDATVSMDDFYNGVHPDDADRTFAAFKAAMDPKVRANYDVEYRTIGKNDGVIRWVGAKGKAQFDKDGRCIRILGSAIDITERKRIEEKLRDLNAKLEARVAERTQERDRTWNNSRDLLLVLDTNGIFQATNPVWNDILGWTTEDLLGRYYLEIVHPDDHLASEDALARASKEALPTFLTKCLHKDGSIRWI